MGRLDTEGDDSTAASAAGRVKYDHHSCQRSQRRWISRDYVGRIDLALMTGSKAPVQKAPGSSVIRKRRFSRFQLAVVYE